MAREDENAAFICAHCNKHVLPLTNGSYRNHCPFCLYSLHVDNKPGDRASLCHGLMQPSGLEYKRKKGWQIIHVCIDCGHRSLNKIAVDTVQADDFNAVNHACSR